MNDKIINFRVSSDTIKTLEESRILLAMIDKEIVTTSEVLRRAIDFYAQELRGAYDNIQNG